MEFLKEKNAVLEKTNQNVKYTYNKIYIAFYFDIKSCNVNIINFCIDNGGIKCCKRFCHRFATKDYCARKSTSVANK